MHSEHPVKRGFRFRLRRRIESPSYLARTLTRAALESLSFEPLIDNAEYIVTELVANALENSSGDVTLYLADEGETFFVGVWDSNPQRPTAPKIDLYAESGRGLLIVASLSASHGCYPTGGGKVVWARLSTPKGE